MKNGSLPKGWAFATVGRIADCRLGKMLDQSKNRGDLRPYLRNVNVQWGRIDLDDIKEIRITSEEVEQYAVVRGDVLVCEGGEPGRCAVWSNDREMYLQKALHRVRPRGGNSPEYLRWWLQDATSDGRLEALFTGSTIKHLPGRQLAQVTVALPPVAEQRRIAARIHDIDSHRAAAAARLQAACTVVDRFRSAVLAAACSGRLTEDWREGHPDLAVGNVIEVARDRRRQERGTRPFNEPRLNPHTGGQRLPDEWSVVPLGLLVRDIKYGTSKRSAHDAPGTPILRIPNVSAGVLDVEELKFAELDESERESLTLRAGDLLMIRSNGSVQRVGVTVPVTSAGEGMAYAGYLIRLRTDEEFLDPSFLRLALASPELRAQIELPARSTSGVHNINTQEVRGLGIALPPLGEQGEIVRRADAMLATADRLATQIERTSATLDRVSKTTLAKAFRGELLPTEAALAEQGGRDFESAEELLIRIDAAEASQTKRGALGSRHVR